MRKNPILFILLFSLIFLLFFSGCQPTTAPDLSTGTISGQAALPGSSSKDITGYTPIPGATVTVIDAQGNTHTTLTDSNGFYSFDNIPIKANTIINITKDTAGGGKIVFMEIIPQPLSPEENFYAGIADAESTALALVIEALINLGQLQEEINLEEIISTPGFAQLEEAIRQAQGNNQDILTLSSIITQTQAIADYIVNPPPPAPAPTPTPLTAIEAITGTAQVGETLTAGALTPSGATATYQWQICATSDGTYENISLATSTTYTPVAGDVTKFIKVAATGTDNYSGTVTSDPKAAVTAAVIGTAAIPGVTAAVTGATPVSAITATAQYTGTVTWVPTEDPFAEETAYTATITLIPKAGFTLTGVAENFFAVAGAVATNPTDSGVVTAIFPETAVFPVTAAAVINIAAISGVTVPVTSATPKTAITETAQYTGTVTWYPANDPFQGGKVYVVTITLTAEAGYTLTGVAANFFTVAGATIVTNTTDSGVVKAVFPETLGVGASYGGGIVAYILQPGEFNGVYYYDAGEQHGLIAATADQSTEIVWITGGSTQTTLNGNTLTALGEGQANTNAMKAQNGYTGGAAKVCDDYSVTVGSVAYTDWFLPSKDELDKLYLNKVAIGGFADTDINPFYWSSSEYDANDAWSQNFNDGAQINYYKYYTLRVRAVRAF